MKTEIQNEKDRLSDLPDSIILHILSFLNIEKAHQTSILSKRWKNVPKHLRTLILKPTDFNYKYLHSLDNFVSRILSLRDPLTSLHTLDLMEYEHYYDHYMEPDIVKSIVEYAVSHNVQLLRITITCDIQQFPSCFFSSETLTSLHLGAHHKRLSFPNSLNLPALTTLTLRNFYFCVGADGCAEPFSAFNKLDTLIIEDCLLLDAQILCISSTTLINLTVNFYGCAYHYFDSYKCKLSTPSLCNLNYTGILIQTLCHSDLCSLKHVCIDVYHPYSEPYKEYYPFVLSLFLELGNIESLTVSSTTLQVLCCVPNLFKVKLTSLNNLESLQVKEKLIEPPTYYDLIGLLEYDEVYKLKPDRIVDFLLQNSPSATVIKSSSSND